MTDLMMQLADSVSDGRGAFHVRVMARDRSDGRWEGWLEFAPDDADADTCYMTPIETRQRDRLTMERWATGLTHVYAEGALARAQLPQSRPVVSELVFALEEIVTALDRRVPHVERAAEARIAADAAGLRADAVQRIARLGGPPRPRSAARRRPRRKRYEV